MKTRSEESRQNLGNQCIGSLDTKEAFEREVWTTSRLELLGWLAVWLAGWLAEQLGPAATGTRAVRRLVLRGNTPFLYARRGCADSAALQAPLG